MSVLEPKKLETFNVGNDVHLEAAHIMLEEGRLHPSIRFRLDGPFTNVFDMIKHTLALKYTTSILGKEFNVKKSLSKTSIPTKGYPELRSTSHKFLHGEYMELQ